MPERDMPPGRRSSNVGRPGRVDAGFVNASANFAALSSRSRACIVNAELGFPVQFVTERFAVDERHDVV
jgi:hypothetical protein